jgi:hypothetical protein
MEALVAVVILGFLLWAKNQAAAGGQLTASGSLTVTSSNAPGVDPNAPSQAGPIGNTFLSQTESVMDPYGNVIDLPFRPSAPHNGGGIAANYGLLPDNSTNSVGSGTGSIEKINAPAASTSTPSGGASRFPVAPSYGGRSALFGRLPAPIVIFRQATPSPAASAAPPAPQRVIAAPGGRTAILSANTTGVRAASNSSTAMPSAAGVDFHAAPVTTPQATPQQIALARRINLK